MPATQTSGDLIIGAMRLIGALATGETPSASESNDGLNALNDLLEQWSLENLAVWGTDNQTFTSIANQWLYTIGPAGNFATVRPIRISGAYATYNGVDFDLDIIGEDEYNRISLKTQGQSYPEKLCYINSSPLGVIKLWPVPNTVLPIVLAIDQVLTQVPNLVQVIGFPPGYYIGMKHALAILLAGDYGITPNPIVAQVAQGTKANLKRANKKKRQMTFDPAFTSGPIRIWQTG